MSKINAVRFLDARVNGGSRLITNKVIPFNGNTTLLFGGNGIGKTSLVNLIQSIFVHAGKRKEFLDRSFSSYFHYKPTYIMVEFLLDDNAGKLLVGLMGQLLTQKEQDLLGQSNDLKLSSFVYHYPVDSGEDIYRVPFITNENNKDVMMNWLEAQATFKKYKKKHSLNFDYYNMNDSHEQRKYFDKLHEYNIEYTHWEDIIYKLNNNKAEGGISAFFQEDKSKQDFIDNRIIPLIVKKLDGSGQNQTEKFADHLHSLIRQKRNNQQSLAAEQSYTNALRVLDELIDKLVILQERFEAPLQLTAKKAAYIRNEASKHMKELNSLIENYTKEIEVNNSLKTEYEMERDSLLYYKAEDAYLDIKEEYEIAMNHKRDIELSLNDKKVSERVYRYLTLEQELNDIKVDIVTVNTMIEKAKSPDDVIQSKIATLGGKLHSLYLSERDRLEKAIDDNNLLIEETKEAMGTIESKLKNTESELGIDNQTIGGYVSQINTFEVREKKFNRDFDVELVRNPLTYQYEYDELESIASDLLVRSERLKADKHNNEVAQDTNETNLKDNETKVIEKKNKLVETLNEIKHHEKYKKTLDNKLEERLKILPAIGFSDERKFDNEAIIKAFNQKINENRIKKEAEQKEFTDLESKYNKLTAGEMVYISPEMAERFIDLDVSVEQGFAWLQNAKMNDDQKTELLAALPFLPNALIVDREKDIEILQSKALSLFTDTLIPIVLRKDLKKIRVETHPSDLISVSNNLHFLYAFDQSLLTDEGLAKAKADNLKAQEACQKRFEQYEKQELQYDSDLVTAHSTSVSEDDYKNTIETLRTYTEEQDSLKAILDGLEKQHKTLLAEKDALQKEAKSLDDDLSKNTEKNRQFKAFKEAYEDYQTIQSKYDILDKKIKNAKLSIDKLKDDKEKLTETLHNENTRKGSLRKDLGDIESLKLPKYTHYAAVTVTDEVLAELETAFNELNSQRTDDLKQAEDKLVDLEERKTLKESDMQKIKQDKYTVVRDKDIQAKTLSDFASDFDDTIQDEIATLNNEKEECIKREGKLETKLENKKATRNKQHELFLQRYPNQDKVDRHIVSQYTPEKYKTDIDNIEKDNQKLEKAISNNRHISDVIHTDLPILDTIDSGNDYTDVQFSIDYNKFSTEIRSLEKTYNDDKKELIYEWGKVISFYEDQIRDETSDQLKPMYSVIVDALKQIGRPLNQLIKNIKIRRKATDDRYKKAASDNKQIKDDQNQILGLLFEYTGKIIGELGKFGKKTSINEFNKRLFKIELKSGYTWSDKEQDYRHNLARYLENKIDEIVDDTDSDDIKQIKKAITPTILFKKTVGEDNVLIKILKIEQNHTQYIHWQNLEELSGGERTLSSFIIIASLMYYAYETNDLLDSSSGGIAPKQRKMPSMVLLLDNPFGQLTSAHLLQPMFKLAEKLDIQLISLTDIRSDLIANMHPQIVAMGVHRIHTDSNVQEIIDMNVDKEPKEQIGMARFSLEQSSLDLFSE